MTNDDLDRALGALPLEEPPAGLHARIMAATVLRAPAAFRPWELWLLAGVVVLTVWLTYLMLASSPDAATRVADFAAATMRGAGLFSVRTYLWLAIGISSAIWISSLPFMPPPHRTVYNR